MHQQKNQEHQETQRKLSVIAGKHNPRMGMKHTDGKLKENLMTDNDEDLGKENTYKQNQINKSQEEKQTRILTMADPHRDIGR